MNSYIGSRSEYSIRCTYFKRIPNTSTYEDKPREIFYCKILTPMTKTPIIVNGRVKDMRKEIALESISNIKDLNVDDKVLFRGELLRAEKILVEEITSTEFSSRPYKRTQMVLVG